MNDLLSRLRSYDCKEGCIGKTDFVPIHRDTLRVIIARLEALEAVEPYMDRLICYASGTEYPPNAAVKRAAELMAGTAGCPATEIGRLVSRIVALAPKAGLFVGIKIEPARSRECDHRALEALAEMGERK